MSDAWKARLLPASWRGIPFFVDTHELQGGRHAVQHEPPDRNSNFAEDIGRKSKKYNIDCHILGDNYFFIRDALIDAMEKRGAGTLIHPYLGIKQVQPDGYTVREDTLVGRFASLSLSFIEAGEPSFPFAAIDKVTDFFTSLSTAIAQIKNAFQVAYSISQLPAFAVEAFKLQITEAANTIENLSGKVRTDPEEQAFLKSKTTEVKGNTQTLATNPATNAEETDAMIFRLTTLVPDPPDSFTIDSSSGRDDKLSVFNDLLVFGDSNEDLPETTPTRRQEKVNALAYTDMIQQLAIVRLASQVVAKQFNSNAEAGEARRLITENIDKQLKKDRTQDEVFQALEDLNAKLVLAVPDTGSDLANEKDIVLLDSVPSIVLAYDLYQSPAQEIDIIKRNKVRNPGFVVGNITVLSET